MQENKKHWSVYKMRMISNEVYAMLVKKLEMKVYNMTDFSSLTQEEVNLYDNAYRGGMDYVLSNMIQINDFISIPLATTNDVNGNPRRLRLIIDVTNACIVDILDEGYRGVQVTEDEGYTCTNMYTKVNIQPKEFNNLRKLKKLYKKEGK